ncbi:hypothetical protein OF83DRAFT_1179154 [Amylostereum chailletii]|nr:hypothetical protein OF83DRAFT_1179154 [Amylostereum chailletii]
MDAPWYKSRVATGSIKLESVNEPDMSNFDIAALPCVPEMWTLELHENVEWLVDMDGQAYITKGWWLMACNDGETTRMVHPTRSKPTESDVLTFVRQSFAESVTGTFKQGFPNRLLISPAFKPYQSGLHALLHALPEPVAWKFDSEPRTQSTDLSHLMLDVLYSAGRNWKGWGNQAYAEKNAKLARDAYTCGIGHLERAVREHGARGHCGKLEDICGLLAVCCANRAAVYLLDGKEFSPQKAEADGRRAEELEPGYAKGYYRQARAHECLGDVGKACEVLERALRQKELKNDVGIQEELDRYRAMAAA